MLEICKNNLCSVFYITILFLLFSYQMRTPKQQVPTPTVQIVGKGKASKFLIVLYWAGDGHINILQQYIIWMYILCSEHAPIFKFRGKLLVPRQGTTDKTFGITVEAFEDKVNLDKAIQCPKDLWECPTQAILVGVVKDTAQEEPIIPEPGVEETTQIPDDPAQHFDNNLPSQLIDKPLIETFIIKDKIREHEVRNL